MGEIVSEPVALPRAEQCLSRGGDFRVVDGQIGRRFLDHDFAHVGGIGRHPAVAGEKNFGAASSAVNPTPVVKPTLVNFIASGGYTIGGGTIGGSAGVSVNSASGTGVLTFTSNNTYTGLTTITSGTLQLGNNTTAGTIGSASAVGGTGGTLAISHSNAAGLPFVLPNSIGGSVNVTNIGSGSTVLSGSSSYTGITTISSGILSVTNANGTTSSLGTFGDVFVSGGTLNLGGYAAAGALNSFGSKLFHLSGDNGGIGAITDRDYVTDPTGNTGGNQQLSALQNVQLDSAASIGGPGTDMNTTAASILGRFDIRATSAALNLNGNNLTKIGNDFVDLVNTSVSGSGNVEVAAGTFGLEGTTTFTDDGMSNITLDDGSMLQLWGLGAAGATNITRAFIVGDGTATSGAFMSLGSSTSTIGSNITLNGNLTVRYTANNFNSSNLTLAGNISEDTGTSGFDRALYKNSTAVLTLSGSNSFTGGLFINPSAGGTNITSGTATVQLGAGDANALPAVNVVSMGPASSFTSDLQLNGNSITIAGLQTATTTGAAIVEDANATSATLTVDVAGTNSYVYGTSGINAILQDGTGTGTLALVKAGSGVLTLGGQSTFTGGIDVQSGELIANRSSSNNGNSGALGKTNVGLGRTITVESGATLELDINNIFGNNNNAVGNLPTLFIDGTMNATQYNQLGAVSLSGGTLSQASTASGSYEGYQFLGTMTVTGTAPSTISTSNGKANHLSANTDFIVADVTGDPSPDLIVSAPLRDQSGDYGLAAGGLSKEGPGTMFLSGNSSYTGGTTVNGGTLIVSHVHGLGQSTTNGLTINNTALVKITTGTGAGPVVLPSLSINGDTSPVATLDLTSSKMVITNTSYASAVSAYTVARAQVTNALDGFAWDQPGITSSTVANDINNLGVPTSVAVILNNSSGTAGGGAGDASDELFYSDGSGSPTTNPNGLPQFAGTSVDQNSVLFKYTYIGDSNLDGMVDSTDFGLFLAGYNDPGTAASLGWAVGDYDYSGTVDSTDFGLFLAGYNYYASNPIPLGWRRRRAAGARTGRLSAGGVGGSWISY